MIFFKVSDISDVANNILRKRYLRDTETSWEDVVNRVINHVMPDESKEIKSLAWEMLLNRYFIPNSPCLVNSGTDGGGLNACYVVDFPDTIEGIYKTKLDFALIARKGGGCGTSLSKLRPEGSKVGGSTHGYSAGPINFYNTICHDMEILTQGGFRAMAQMGTMSVYHPDIIKFITAKTQEGKMTTTNISVVVNDSFMRQVIDDDSFRTFFCPDGTSDVKFYDEYKARDVFNLIVDSAWKNGEPGLLFYDRINDSPYKYSGQEIQATNPCGEQPLPSNGVCNLGSLDISKFLYDDNTLNLELLELAVRVSIRFLDNVCSVSSFPTKDISEWVEKNRPVGLGIMGLADYYMKRGVAYGSEKALEELGFILGFIKNIAEDESISLGEEKGVPENCKVLPVPRRNITVLSIAPTGTISLLAGCNSGIEPFFSDLTKREDRTGSYEFDHADIASLEWYRCAVSANGAKEVTWQEHIDTQAVAQKFVDSGVSKTINFPNKTHRDTVGDAFIYAWKSGVKGITVYRNGSRELEVLKPKNLKKDQCPICNSDLIRESGCAKCSDPECGFSICEVA